MRTRGMIRKRRGLEALSCRGLGWQDRGSWGDSAQSSRSGVLTHGMANNSFPFVHEAEGGLVAKILTVQDKGGLRGSAKQNTRIPHPTPPQPPPL